LFFINLIVNYNVNHLRLHVSVIIFLKKHIILLENSVSSNSEWIYGQNAPPPIIEMPSIITADLMKQRLVKLSDTSVRIKNILLHFDTKE
jgi:hypothetical protein